MTVAARSFAVATLLVVAGCSLSHRSGDFACQTRSDCSAGRVCNDGFCVVMQVDAGGRNDAQPGRDANGCPPECTSCEAAGKTCTIDCALNGGACAQEVTCPAGWSCDIQCSTGNACGRGVRCEDSAACTISCSGAQSCRNVTCGAGRCEVNCSGTGSCREIQCGDACACDVSCGATASCSGVACRSDSCTTVFGGCSSLSFGCDTCP